MITPTRVRLIEMHQRGELTDDEFETALAELTYAEYRSRDYAGQRRLALHALGLAAGVVVAAWALGQLLVLIGGCSR